MSRPRAASVAEKKIKRDVVETLIESLDESVRGEARAMLEETIDDADARHDLLTYLWLLSTNELDVARERLAVNTNPKNETVHYTNTEFTCPGCGKRESTTWERQTRSLDEAATVFARCVCGKVWKPPQ